MSQPNVLKFSGLKECFQRMEIIFFGKSGGLIMLCFAFPGDIDILFIPIFVVVQIRKLLPNKFSKKLRTLLYLYAIFICNSRDFILLKEPKTTLLLQMNSDFNNGVIVLSRHKR